MKNWLLLHYKLPNDPSALRVYIWRKLKRLGAFLYQDAVWVLPNTSRTLEQFQWLSAEISELGGEAALWEAQLALPGSDDGLTAAFSSQLDAPYQEILDSLNQPGVDLEALSRQYQQIKSRDFFKSEIGQRVRDALLESRGGSKE